MRVGALVTAQFEPSIDKALDTLDETVRAVKTDAFGRDLARFDGVPAI